MSRERQALGRRGEARAARFLRRRGLRLVAKNWRDRSGDELDLVMRDPRTDQAVIVEVRTQDGRGARGAKSGAAGSFAGGPVATIGPRKIMRLTRAAERWLAASRWRPSSVRIDVVALCYLGWFRWKIEWFPNAITT